MKKIIILIFLFFLKINFCGYKLKNLFLSGTIISSIFILSKNFIKFYKINKNTKLIKNLIPFVKEMIDLSCTYYLDVNNSQKNNYLYKTKLIENFKILLNDLSNENQQLELELINENNSREEQIFLNIKNEKKVIFDEENFIKFCLNNNINDENSLKNFLLKDVLIKINSNNNENDDYLKIEKNYI